MGCAAVLLENPFQAPLGAYFTPATFALVENKHSKYKLVLGTGPMRMDVHLSYGSLAAFAKFVAFVGGVSSNAKTPIIIHQPEHRRRQELLW